MPGLTGTAAWGHAAGAASPAAATSSACAPAANPGASAYHPAPACHDFFNSRAAERRHSSAASLTWPYPATSASHLPRLMVDPSVSGVMMVMCPVRWRSKLLNMAGTAEACSCSGMGAGMQRADGHGRPITSLALAVGARRALGAGVGGVLRVWRCGGCGVQKDGADLALLLGRELDRRLRRLRRRCSPPSRRRGPCC